MAAFAPLMRAGEINMNVRGTNRLNSFSAKNNRAKVAVMLFSAVSAAPALASTVAQVEAQPSGTSVTLTDNPIITYICSQPGATVDGYTYSNWSFLVNDGTGSLDLFGTLPAGTTYTPTVGDAISAAGTYSPYSGIPEIDPISTISKVSSGNSVPSALTVTIPQLDAAATTPNYNLSEYLVTVKDVTFSGATTFATHGNTTLTATDSTGNPLTIYQWASSYSQAAQFGGEAVPTGYQDITGIFDIYNSAPEFIPFAITPSAAPPPPPPNNSTLFITAQANQNSNVTVTDSKDATVTSIGALVNVGSDGANGDEPQQLERVVLKGGSATTTIQLGASSSVSTDTTTYSASPAATNGAHGGAGGTNDPIPAGQTDTATVGYGPSDTAVAGGSMTNGGSPGALQFVNENNSSDAPVNVTLPSIKVLESRFLDAGTSKAGTIVGDILVGKSGSTQAPLISANTDTNNDFSSNTLTNVTLLANSTSAAYTQTDPFSGATVAKIQATAPSYTQVFGGPNQGFTEVGNSGAFNNVGTSTAPLPGTTLLPGDVTLTVSPVISGTYGDDHPVTVGSTTETYSSAYTDFAGSAGGVVGMGIPGENESIDVYAQYSGFQAASVTATGTLTSSGGNITLTNAATNDNTPTKNGVTGNIGIRDSAWVTSSSGNQDGWSSNLTPATPGSSGGEDSPGTTISGSQNAPGDPNSYSTVATISYNPALALAGTYSGGTYSIGLENAQYDQNNVVDQGPIQGTTHNDLAPVTVPMPAETGTDTTGAGTYMFGGGTFVASGVTHLTGSFTQSGGSTTFSQFTGSGSVTITGGTAKIATGHTVNTLASLSISGTGLLDITNNTLSVSGGSLSTITALIKQGYNGGAWTGTTGITSSSAAAKAGTAVGVGIVGGIVEIKYTWYGDLDLDGAVTNADLLLMGTAGGGWAHGDLNYDGVVNQDDYALFMLGAADAGSKNISSVPEPTLLSALVLPAMIGLRRRRRA
jgi:hypothetical protein